MKSRAKIQGLAVVAAAVLLASAAIAQEHAYVGSRKCKTCHLKQWKSWSETRMGQAFETLKPGNSVDAKLGAGLDPEQDYTLVDGCVVCHVTGFGQKGGFVDIETTPELAGVGCESCHGPGGTYTQDEYMSLKNREFKRSEIVAVGLTEEIGPAQCIVCHNPASPLVSEDDIFDFEMSKERDTHEHFALKYEH